MPARNLTLTAALLAALASTAAAQTGGAIAEPSGRATTTVSLRRGGQPGGRITIEYGQPHARGRKVMDGLIPSGSVWRLGANAATMLTTDVDLVIGGTRVPKGSYTLWTMQSQGKWQLIINKQTGQWGTSYDQSQDLARVAMQSRRLAEPIESFTIWLVPAAAGAARGTLRLAWGDVEASTEWSVAP
ncbi:MAG TPA: DUF2911 domain-containing protein [Gemmatimonadaceae bacterium]|nr:DUF2911 domain-containing protein [Gemmatimonadaceae bacterium]